MSKVIALAMVFLLALSAMACDSGASDEELQAEYDRGFAAGQTTAGEGMEKVSTVGVALGEWSITPTPNSVPAGLVRFAVANGGPDDPHELVIFKTDLPIDQLEQIAIANTEERGFLPEEGVDGVEFIGEVEEFDPGEQRSGVFELEAGNYVFICNIVEPEELDEEGNPESHLLEGMAVPFTVT